MRKLYYIVRNIWWNIKNGFQKFFSNRRKQTNFYKQFNLFNQSAPQEYRALKSKLYPCLNDATEFTYIEPTYFYQDAWAFEQIISQNPNSHIDIGSQNKFVALLSKVVPTTMIDIRPLSLSLDSIKFIKGDILNIPFSDKSIDSLSCLCVIEHIGLGRYGDPLDPLGSEKAFREVARVISPGGHLYISVPVEKQNTVYFNAHRSFTEDYILSFFADFKIIDKKYIYGNSFGDKTEEYFGTGCYHLQRKNL